MTRTLIRIMRAWAGRLRTSRPRVSWWQRVLLGALLVGPFSMLVAWLRLRTLLRGPIAIDCRSEDGVVFRCHPPDLVQMYIALFGLWEPDLTAFVRRRLEPGDAFIDVGANIGYFTLLASPLVGSRGKVVAIDASPSMVEALRANVDRNGAPENVRVVARAVSDQEESLSVFAGPAHNVGLATTVPGRGRREEARVQAAPLADLLEDAEIAKTRLVKIDVEGAEPAVIRGLARFLERCPREVELLIELSPDWWDDARLTPREALRPLLDVGFNVYQVPNNYWPWRYLWPRDVARPRRATMSLDRRVKRLDLVLSREAADEL